MKTHCPKIVLLFCFCLIGNAGFLAQGLGQHKSKVVRKLQKAIWIAGISGTVIDDDAKAFKDVFDVGNTWNFLYFPSKIDLEGFIVSGVSMQAAFTYSQLKQGKLLGEQKIARPKNVNLIAVDFNAKLYPKELSQPANGLSPYAISGFGFTYRSLTERQTAITFNFGFGLNIWMGKGFGMNVQSMAKFALNKASSRNYLQHALGLIYRFSILKGNKAVSSHPGPRHHLFSGD